MTRRNAPAARDWAAADAIKSLREARGLSREQLAAELAILATKNTNNAYAVSSRTVYRIEEQGAVPTVRVKFALATFFNLPVSEIWPSRRRARSVA